MFETGLLVWVKNNAGLNHDAVHIPYLNYLLLIFAIVKKVEFLQHPYFIRLAYAISIVNLGSINLSNCSLKKKTNKSLKAIEGKK
jgi:hypothetical protein